MNNKMLIYGLISTLVIILLVSLGAGLYISNGIYQASSENYLLDSMEPPRYHVMVIVDDSNQTYGDEFLKGINEAAVEYRVAVEIVEIDGDNYQEDVFDALDMAMYAKVDGIIVHAFRDTKLQEKIEFIYGVGIPVITLNEDLEKSSLITYVGVNQYVIGQAAGDALAKKLGEEGRIAVIQQKGYEDTGLLASGEEDLMVLGLKDALKNYQGIRLEVVRYTEVGVLSAETVTTQILRDYPSINGIFCADGQNTLGVVQMLLDNNLVPDITLIGNGDDDEILDYIEKGSVIEATIITDYQDIGGQAIKAFYDNKNNIFVSNYIDTALQIIDVTNVQEYKVEKSDIDAQIK